MSRLVYLLFILVFCVSANLAIAAPSGQEHIYKEVDGRKMRLYVTQPNTVKEGATSPTIVFFHGGGWVGGTPGQFNEHVTHLASRGMVCVQVEYRLLDKKSKDAPEICVADAVDGVRWVQEHAKQLGIDRDRIATSGGSAGGHLAAYLGTSDSKHNSGGDFLKKKPAAMVLYNPVYDNGPDGWGTARVKDRYYEFSPAHQISGDDPPHIVFLGAEDKLIPVSTAKNFQDKMTQAGVKSDLHIFEGQGHGFFNAGRKGGKYEETLALTDQFFVRMGWIPEKE